MPQLRRRFFLVEDVEVDGRGLRMESDGSGASTSRGDDEFGVKRDAGKAGGTLGRPSVVASNSSSGLVIRLPATDLGVESRRAILILALALPLLKSKDTRGRRAIRSGEGELKERRGIFGPLGRVSPIEGEGSGDVCCRCGLSV